MADVVLVYPCRWMTMIGLILFVWVGSCESTTNCEGKLLKAADSSNLVLLCMLQYQGKDEVYWTKNTSPISNGKKMLPGNDKLLIDYKYMYDRNLVITEPRRGLAGVYKCHNRRTREVLECYNVTYKPADLKEEAPITSPSLPVRTSVSVLAGGTAHLWCNITSESARWYMVVGETLEEDIRITGRKLEIRDVSEHCGSRYVCKQGGVVQCVLDLDIRKVNAVIQRNQSDNNVILKCNAEGSVKSIIRMQWFLRKDGKTKIRENATLIADDDLITGNFGEIYNVTVSNNASIMASSLSFQAKKDTRGLYLCEVRVQDASGSVDPLIVKSQTVEVT